MSICLPPCVRASVCLSVCLSERERAWLYMCTNACSGACAYGMKLCVYIDYSSLCLDTVVSHWTWGSQVDQTGSLVSSWHLPAFSSRLMSVCDVSSFTECMLVIGTQVLKRLCGRHLTNWAISPSYTSLEDITLFFSIVEKYQNLSGEVPSCSDVRLDVVSLLQVADLTPYPLSCPSRWGSKW